MDRFSLLVASLYAGASALWILFSDQTVAAIVAPQHHALAQTLKGWGFVAATALLIYVVLSQEMRRRAEVEAELRDARHFAERANATKGRFLAAMSHELRTPLNAINGYSEMMLQETFGALGNPLYRQHAEIIHVSGRHLLALIDDLLDISRLDLNKLEVELRPQRLRTIVDEACRLMRGRAEEKGLNLTYLPADGDDLVLGDRVRLKQVLLNLIGNAVRYTDAGGVTVRLQPRDHDIAIEIADTGAGIDPGLLATSRTPFAAHAGRRIEAPPHGTGAGLGLPLSHLLIERHGGHLEIDSAPGEGTTVRTVLPLPATAATAGAEGAAAL